jgi:hypothetical protein
MTQSISKQVMINAYNSGLVPTTVYAHDKNNILQVSSKLPSLEPFKLSTRSKGNNNTYVKNSPSVDALVKHFDTFKSAFNPDGTPNPHCDIAEDYAISLAMEEKFEASLTMFNAIIGNKKTINDIAVRRNNEVLPVARRCGILGYKGLFELANVCYELGSKDNSDESKALLERSKNVFVFIANLPTNYRGGAGFCEVKTDSLNILVSLFNMKKYEPLLKLSPTITR